jgi:hypothetical protein
MTNKKAKNCPDFRCETCEDGRIGYVSRLNQNNFLSFFFCHTFMQRSHIGNIGVAFIATGAIAGFFEQVGIEAAVKVAAIGLVFIIIASLITKEQ